NIAEPGAGPYQFDSFIKAFLSDPYQTLGGNAGFADKIHLAGVAMVAILDHSGVDIQDVTFFQDFLVTGNAVANHMVDRGADGFGKALVIEGGGNRLLHFRNILDRKSTRLNSSHVKISYAVFCLKKKNT